jgi:hypothetical protein
MKIKNQILLSGNPLDWFRELSNQLDIPTLENEHKGTFSCSWRNWVGECYLERVGNRLSQDGLKVEFSNNDEKSNPSPLIISTPEIDRGVVLKVLDLMAFSLSELVEDRIQGR